MSGRSGFTLGADCSRRGNADATEAAKNPWMMRQMPYTPGDRQAFLDFVDAIQIAPKAQ